MTRHTITATAIAAALATTLDAGEPKRIADIPELEGLSERWEEALDGLKVAGMSVGLVRNGEIVALDSFGIRNAEGDPVDSDTMFYIASCTKTYTAAGLAALAEAGKVDLDAPIRTYLPRFEVADAETSSSATIRDMLSHKPGINSFPIVFLDAYTGEITEDRYYRWLKDVTPTGEVSYSNVHFTIAGRVIEAASGQPWKDYLNDRIFDRAGMTRTTAYASEMYGDDNCAIPMQWVGATYVGCPTRKSDRTMHAAGGMGTTARDGARWIQLQLADGLVDGKAVLSTETTRSLRSRQSTSPQPRGRIRRIEGFGLGWMLGTYRDRPYAQHGGGYIGTAAHLSFLPEENIGVVVLCNADAGGQGMTAIVSIDTYDRLLGETGHPDLLPNYTERIKSFLADAAATPTDNLVAEGGLTLAPAEYVGRYEDDDWGTLLLAMHDGELAGRIGDLKLVLVSTGEDKFHARTDGGDGYQATFVVEHGRVAAVICEGDSGTIRFDRAR